MPAVAAVVAAFVFWAGAVRVEGTTSCPTPALVAARLAEILPASPDGADPELDQARDRARLSNDGGELVISLESADGTVLATRRLPGTYKCEELASAAAVSVAAWESDVHPQFASALAARSPPPAVHLQSAAAAPPSSPALEPWKMSAGLGFGVGGSVDVPLAAGDLFVGAWLAPPDARTTLRVELEGQSTRQISLQEGRASWRRWIVGVGLERPFFAGAGRPASARVRGFAVARLARLDLRGEGFALNHDDHAFDPGAALGMRALLVTGRWPSWIELAVSVWPVRHDAVAAGSNEVGRLPTAEAFVRVGVGRVFLP